MEHETSTASPLSNNHSRFGTAALMVTAIIYTSPVRTDNMSVNESTEGVVIPTDRTVAQLHAAIRRGARILSASVDEASEARLDQFMAATAVPAKKTKLVRR